MALTHLVVGTGRCGTGSVRKLLRDTGVRCGHEAFFGVTRREPNLTDALIEERGRRRTDLAAESSWLAAPFLQRSTLLSNETRVIHLYRHPYRVIKSMLDLKFFHPDNEHPEYPRFAFQHAPRLSHHFSDIRNALIFYIDWNTMIRRDLYRFTWSLTHQVEQDVSPLCEFLGVPEQPLMVVNQKSADKALDSDLQNIIRRIQAMPEFPELVQLNENLSYEL